MELGFEAMFLRLSSETFGLFSFVSMLRRGVAMRHAELGAGKHAESFTLNS